MADSVPPPPGSEVDRLQKAQQATEKMMHEAEKAGIPSFKFDPDAPPEEKAAQVKKAAPPGLDLAKEKVKDRLNQGNTAVVTDIGDNGAPTPALPTPKSPTTNGATNGATNGEAKAEPAQPKKPKHPPAGEGNWEPTGWEPRFGSLNDALNIDQYISADHQTWVEATLDDKFFGDWYHNAGIIAFAVISTWIITLLRGGLAWIILIGACCATYYRTSIRRVRRNIRDEINREMQKTRIATDVETLEWINSFVVKFWPIYHPVMGATIINIVDGILAAQAPGFIDSIRLAKFNLGTKPPRLEHVKTYPNTEDDIVETDWKFSFTPNDTTDLTSRQIKNKINPKIILEVRVGKGIASKGIPIVVEDMACSGIMKFKIKLQIPFPHIELVDVCFLEPPKFDYVLKPVGGDLGLDVGLLPGLKSFIEGQVHNNLGPMFYAPNVFTVEVAKMLGGAPIDTAIGVIALTIHRARGLKNTDKFSGTPDPYVSLSINDRNQLARTKTVHENADPKWNETHYIIVTNLNDSLSLKVFDYNDVRKDKELGVASFPLENLREIPEHEGVEMPVTSGGKTRGQLSFDVRYFPVLEGATLEDGTKQPPPESNSGIVRFTVSQCKELDSDKSMVGQLSPYAVMSLNGKTIHRTKTVKRNNAPAWEESHEILVTNRNQCKLGIQIKDDRDLLADPLLGSYQLSLKDFLDSVEKGVEWFNLSGTKSGRVKMRVQWKPVALTGILGGSGGYVTPIGVMRLHLQNAKNLRNLEALGKSDPYVRVMLNGYEKARTVTFSNELNPDWDEVLYVPVHSAKEKLTLEVMDAENMGKDRSLGLTELDLKEFIKEDEDGLFMIHAEKNNRSEGLVLGKSGAKGTLNYTAAFYPCMNLADPEDEKDEKEGATNSETASQAKKSEENLAAPADQGPAKSPTSPTFSDNGAKGPPRVRLSPEQLLQHESGLLIVKVIDGEFARKDIYLDLIMDDMLFPSFTTSKIRTKKVKLEEIGDAVVRELDFSRITLRIRDEDEDHDENEKHKGKLTGNTRETLMQCLNNPTTLLIKGKDGEVSKVKVSLKYIPILMKLDPSESINNMGTLRVDVLDAANLPAADRNGKSDPYCVFELDGKEVHKTKIQKKTLHPAWNEMFECQVASRTAANFNVEIFDWDMGSKADFLAKTPINLAILEPFQPQTFHFELLGKKGEAGKFGQLRLRMVFKPSYVTRSRQGSSTFHGTFAQPGKIVTGVAGAPLKVGGFAAGGVVKGASFVKKNTFGRLLGKNDDDTVVEEESTPTFDPGMEAPRQSTSNLDSSLRPGSSGSALRSDDSPIGTPPQRTSSLAPPPSGGPAIGDPRSSPHGRSRSTSSQYSSPGVISPDMGTASIRIVSATGFPDSTNLQLRIRPVGKPKDILKTRTIKSASGEIDVSEECTTQCSADQQFKIFAKDNHLVRDTELGEGLFVVDDTGSGQDTVVPVGSEGAKVVLRTAFRSADQGSVSPARKKGLLRR
ncbi:tricalbin [Ascodesmis nigricans]|uniref:Tricalbin n=1 Tax=Ascodesmis nigricans TaxID=341454 RepID=A0A4V3SIM5_9PEZI|nr:tricalbin [Ascodesmis nigricans]